MPNKAFLEITNVCNLKCSFCRGTKRAPRFMSEKEFKTAAARLRPFADYLYFHLMGEPLLHPLLDKFLAASGELGFKVILTTNGTLLKEKQGILLSAPALHKISVSLHSFEANNTKKEFDEYIDGCLAFCAASSEKGIISVLRLWNIGGKNALNEDILARMRQIYGEAGWREGRSGPKIKDALYLEWENHFKWPDMDLPIIGTEHSCYGLRDQIGVLCDGTVVPCCLDADGNISLGNIFESTIDEILESEKAQSLKAQFLAARVKEPLCMRCGFAESRFGKKTK